MHAVTGGLEVTIKQRNLSDVAEASLAPLHDLADEPGQPRRRVLAECRERLGFGGIAALATLTGIATS